MTSAADSIAPAPRPLRKQTLVVLSTHPIQYHAPLYRRLSERGVADLHVIYLSDAGAVAHNDAGFGRSVAWDVPLLDGYAHRVLQPGSAITSRGFRSLHDRGLIGEIEALRPDWLLIYGYASRMNWAAVFWAKRHGVRIAYSSDSNIRDPQRRHRAPIKRVVLRFLFRCIDAFFSASASNVEYLTHYGADPLKIRRVPFSIDVERFRSHSEDEPAQRRYDFVWIGKLIPLKRAEDFVDALGQLAQNGSRPLAARIVGDGPLGDALRARAAALPDNCRVAFDGFVNQSGIPDVLRSADTLVFTSDREAFGLVALEAAAAGLALVIADNIGCVGDADLARPEVNAITYTAGDVDGLVRAMSIFLKNPERLAQARRASVEIAELHDVDRAAERIEQIIGESR